MITACSNKETQILIMEFFKQKLIPWSFTLLSVIVVWQLDFLNALDWLSKLAGAMPGGLTYKIIVNGGVPFLITLLAALSLWFYRVCVWRFFPGSSYRGGWWIYALTSERGDRPARSIGYFKLIHTGIQAYVSEAAAYYVLESDLERRRPWSADSVIVQRGLLKMIFQMQATDPPDEVRPAHYEGYVAIRLESRRALVGRNVWFGSFNDLGDRSHVYGPFYAEWLGKWKRKKADDIEELFRAHATVLIDKTRQ